ncbi:MAG: chaperone modulator CbpM [Azospirillaceae bacterium]|nr:chaperone modulator CbpM [Azospirillaceae bacterium]
MSTLTLLTLETVAQRFPDLAVTEIRWWVEQGWVRPDRSEPDEGAWRFHAVDVARVALIHDLRGDMGVAEDTLPLVLSLIDQVYSLRAALRGVAGVLDHLPPEVRRAVLAAAPQDDKSPA